MFGERPLIDCTKRGDPTVVLGIVSWLGCNRESAHHFDNTDYIIYLEIIMERSKLSWYGANSYYVC
jgi:hypothetical protein